VISPELFNGATFPPRRTAGIIATCSMERPFIAVEIAGNGTIRTAAQNVDAMRSGSLKFTAVDYSDLQVHAFGNVAEYETPG
jgi:hypothetical protein